MSISKIQKHIIKVLADKNIYYLTPTNIKKEKATFFKKHNNNEIYNPKFKYKKILFNKKKLHTEIDILLNYVGPHKKEINNIGNRYLQILNLIENRGKNKFSIYSKQLYKQPSEEQINYAIKILKQEQTTKKKTKKYNAKYVENKFSPIITKYNWKIKLENISSKMRISPGHKTLFINKTSTFTQKEIQRLKYHEIKTHIARSINNEKLPALLRNSFDYIETEEGLALHMEEIHNCTSQEQTKIYAARTIATKLALTNSFHTTFNKLKNYGIDEQTAFQITTRVKRGLTDTSKPGAFTKDHIYLSGKLKIKEYIKMGGDIKDLFLGKISIDDVKKVKNLTTKKGL